MELRHLRYFLVLAEELHFGRAAERLHISQPPLSRQVRDLERKLGAQLFLRERRRISLTPAGAWLRGEAENLLSRASWIERHVRGMGGGQGRYAIGYTGSLLFEVLPEFLQRFRAAWPGWTIAIRELGSEAQVKGILSGELDLGFVRERGGGRGLEYREVAGEAFAAIVPADWEAPEDSPAGLFSLAERPFVGLPRSSAPALVDRVLDLCAMGGFYPDLVLECSELYSVLKLVSKGLGWSIVPALAARNRELPLRSTELSFERGRHGIGVLRRSDDQRGMAESAERLIRELFGERGEGIA